MLHVFLKILPQGERRRRRRCRRPTGRRRRRWRSYRSDGGRRGESLSSKTIQFSIGCLSSTVRVNCKIDELESLEYEYVYDFIHCNSARTLLSLMGVHSARKLLSLMGIPISLLTLTLPLAFMSYERTSQSKYIGVFWPLLCFSP